MTARACLQPRCCPQREEAANALFASLEAKYGGGAKGKGGKKRKVSC